MCKTTSRRKKLTEFIWNLLCNFSNHLYKMTCVEESFWRTEIHLILNEKCFKTFSVLKILRLKPFKWIKTGKVDKISMTIIKFKVEINLNICTWEVYSNRWHVLFRCSWKKHFSALLNWFGFLVWVSHLRCEIQPKNWLFIHGWQLTFSNQRKRLGVESTLRKFSYV